MKIIIETISHDKQRYPTVGDWFRDPDGVMHIRVSEMEDWRYEALVAIHELAEAVMCDNDGVRQDQVDKFDMEFEKSREERLIEAGRAVTEPGMTSGEEALIEIEEPGDQADAPYRTQHCLATGIERIMAAAMGVTWADYEKVIEALP